MLFLEILSYFPPFSFLLFCSSLKSYFHHDMANFFYEFRNRFKFLYFNFSITMLRTLTCWVQWLDHLTFNASVPSLIPRYIQGLSPLLHYNDLVVSIIYNILPLKQTYQGGGGGVEARWDAWNVTKNICLRILVSSKIIIRNIQLIFIMHFKDMMKSTANLDLIKMFTVVLRRHISGF